MTDINRFLRAHGWDEAHQQPLAGDASSRRYIRLCSGAKRALLMIDPQDDTARFAAPSTHLASIGLSAPTIYAREPGLMLIEDFGDAQFARVITDDPGLEHGLYKAATDVLCHLERAALPADIPVVTPDILGDMIEPAFTHYLPALGLPGDGAFPKIRDCLTDLLAKHLPTSQVMVLRDHHAENMIWLPERDGVRRVGLLDFQDALIGPPVYDLVSMLQDARRDVSETCRDNTLAYYLDQTGQSADHVLPAYHLLGIQRNLRILGVFARLAAVRGKPGYLALIPRVWAHIQTSLEAPVSAPLRPLVRDVFPDPIQDRLTAMRSTCLTP
ncbi:phosphotransferase [Marivita sp. S6314]|uniref:aminoglycoside phosphotransferase family protein n=1 Tax=Marivita sp. S6314 TaxID=2926406 RepID=UPI001FF341FB|nr:phosphotransferase [Marivita sp. S6314]MCK0151216.1 phosphotransferase [Marivita sp. S6314]